MSLYGLADIKYDPAKAEVLSGEVEARKRGAPKRKGKIAGNKVPAKKQRTGAVKEVDNQDEEAPASQLAEVQKELAAVKQELTNVKRARAHDLKVRRSRVIYDSDDEAEMPDNSFLELQKMAAPPGLDLASKVSAI